MLTISTVKRRRRYLGGQNNSDSNKGSKDFIAKLAFKPNNARAMIAVSVNQGQVFFDNFISMAPRVSAINILPRDLLVFQLAAGGRVQDLMALIAEGKASLRDHDTGGRSLLHVSSRSTNPMSKKTKIGSRLTKFPKSMRLTIPLCASS